MKLQAGLHGAEIKEPLFDKSQTGSMESGIPMFRDPSEYEHMTKEEKEKLTDSMMAKHKMWSAGKLKG